MFPTTICSLQPLNFGINISNDSYLRQINDLQIRCNSLETQNTQLKQIIYDLTTDQKQRKSQQIVHRSKQRRNTQNFEKKYSCPYTGCKKIYGSDLALNLHVKNKHNGGTKTYRQTVARQIVLAQQKGDPMPHVSINFPPNYLNEFRKRFFQGI